MYNLISLPFPTQFETLLSATLQHCCFAVFKTLSRWGERRPQKIELACRKAEARTWLLFTSDLTLSPAAASMASPHCSLGASKSLGSNLNSMPSSPFF